MLVTDLDRTLLCSNGLLSDYTINVLNKARSRGIKIVMATARPIRCTKEINKLFEFDSCVYHNGAVVQFENDIIIHKGLNNAVDIVQSMLVNEQSLRVAIESCDVLYANYNAKKIWPDLDYISTQDFEECRNKISEKILIEKESIENLNINKYLDKNVYLQLSEQHIAMILHREAKKSNGLKIIAKRYGINLEDVIAFGDDYNDIELLKECGLGVAVKNAYDEVKVAADIICEANEEDGVAKFVSNLLCTQADNVLTK